MDIGVIGCGFRARHLLKQMIEADESFVLCAVADLRSTQVKKELEADGIDTKATTFYTEADEMIINEQLEGILIGTNCDYHSKMAIKVIKAGIPLFLEKPVATNMDDLISLNDAQNLHNSPVVVSFPLRLTPFVKLAKEMIESGKIGTVAQVQAYNNVTYGGAYFHNWYRDENITQGLFLQKATHDFDYVNYILGKNPVKVCALTSKQIFKGDMPAKLKCTDCDKKETCSESMFGADKYTLSMMGEYCCFAIDTGNEDSGSALLLYENGMHMAYTQNFIVRKKAGTRGARFIGFEGTIEFDWYSNDFKVYMHHTPKVEIHKIDIDNKGHGGGDQALIKNFFDLINKKTISSVSSLKDGIQSALICLLAKESAETHAFKDIPSIDL